MRKAKLESFFAAFCSQYRKKVPGFLIENPTNEILNVCFLLDKQRLITAYTLSTKNRRTPLLTVLYRYSQQGQPLFLKIIATLPGAWKKQEQASALYLQYAGKKPTLLYLHRYSSRK
jgi:hypothetical protein